MTHPNLPALPEYLPLWRGEMKDSTIPSGGLVEKARKLKKRSLPSPASPGEGVPTGRDG